MGDWVSPRLVFVLALLWWAGTSIPAQTAGAAGSRVWKSPLMGANIESTPVVGPDGTVYSTTVGGKVFALSPADGTVRWQLQLEGDSRGDLALSPDGTLLVPTFNPRALVAVRVQPGLQASERIRWKTQGIAVYGSPAVAAQGGVVVRSDRSLYRLNPTNANVVWRVDLNSGDFRNRPLIGPDEVVFVGGSDGLVHAFRWSDGSRPWPASDLGLGFLYGDFAVGADGTVYCGTSRGEVGAVDGRSGKVKWVKDPVVGSLADIVTGGVLDAQGRLIVADTGKRLIAMSAATGEVLWTKALLASPDATPVMGADGTVYVSFGGKVSGYASESGNVVMSYETLGTSGSYPSSPVLVNGGILYAGSSDDSIHAIRARTTNGPLSSAWAMRGGDLENTGRWQAGWRITSPSDLPAGTVGARYEFTLQASGGTPPYLWSQTSGSLPAGLNLASNGLLSGTPTVAGTVTFRAQVRDAAGATASQDFQVRILPAALVIVTTNLPAGTVGVAYNEVLKAAGGTPPYPWSVIKGSLPAGVSLSAAGLLSGTPTVEGTFSVTVQVKDAAEKTFERSFTFRIQPPPLAITPEPLPDGMVGVPYVVRLGYTGGTWGSPPSPPIWTLTSGQLVAGLRFSPSGSVSGTPTAAGTSRFTVSLRDGGGKTVEQEFSLTIQAKAAPLVILTTTLPAGKVGVSYSQALQASGGTPPYVWTVVSGVLPAGLSLSPGGSVSGTPTMAGKSEFSVQVKDAAGSTAERQFGIEVQPEAVGGLTFTVGTGGGATGGEVVLPLRVLKFEGIGVFQFSIHWNPTVVEFMAVEGLSLPGLVPGSFGTVQASAGTLTVSWDDPNGASQALPDDAVLFAMRFKILGASGSSTAVTLDGTPTSVEVANAALQPLTPRLVSGLVNVGGTVSIAGRVAYYEGARGVAGTTLAISGGDSKTQSTDAEGGYRFEGLTAGGNFEIRATRTMDSPATLGVTTADITFIRRHVLNIAPLDSPYKLLAADVNASGSVTTADITLVRRMILNPAETLPAGLWRFVRSDHVFDNPSAPWSAPGVRSYAGLSVDRSGQDFVAIKLGDVNGSWGVAGSLAGPGGREGGRRAGLHAAGGAAPVLLRLGRVNAVSGSTVEVPVSVSGFRGVTSVQFTVGWDPSVLGFESAGRYGLPGLAAGNFGATGAAGGRLTFSWDEPGASGLTLEDGTVLFTLTFSVSGSLGTQSPVALVSEPTAPEVTVNFDAVPYEAEAGSVTVGSGGGGAGPVITRLTSAVTTADGGGIRLEVEASGSESLSYQWYRDGVVLTGATASALVIPQATLADAGLYTVRVTAAGGGTITSSAVPVRVAGRPAELQVGLYPGVSVLGSIGATYRIEASPTLGDGETWEPLEQITLSEPVFLWIDKDAPAGRRFYRARLVD